ncbi:MAG: hypothetical protein KL787_04095 [Taibaiella sp.]|nr:hypothetical protein [Taibaiella sp.]
MARLSKSQTTIHLFFPNAIWNYKYYTANDTNNYLLQIKDTNITKQKWGLQNAFSYFTHFINNHHIFYAISNTSSIDIHIYNIEKKKSTSKINLPVNGNIVGRYSTIRWDEKQLLIAGNRLFITTDNLDSIKYEVLTLDNYSPANNHSLQKMYVDNYGNLFIATITDGLRIIKKQNLPISYLGTQKPNANYTLSVLADIENNRILTGISNQGVIVYDTLYRQVHTSENMASLGSVNRIIKVKNGYLFFSNNSTSVYHYDQYLNQKTPVELPNHFTYFNTMLKDEKDTAIVATYFGLYIIDKNSCTVSFKPMTLNEYAACTFHNEKSSFCAQG